MKNKKVLVAVDSSFEDTELIGTLDILNRGNVDFDIYSASNEDSVTGTFATVKTMKISNIDYDKYDGLMIPGGKHIMSLLKSHKLDDVIKKCKEKDYDMYAICAAPQLLLDNGILDGKKYTAFYGYAETKEKMQDQRVVHDGNTITARSMECSIDFGLQIVKHRKGKDTWKSIIKTF